MTSIYDLKQQQAELLDRIYWCEPEDTEADIIKRELEKIEGSVERKLAYLSNVLAEAIAVSRVTTEARKEAQARLELKEKRAARAEEKLREFILSVMTDFNIKKVEGDILNVSQYDRDSLVVPYEPDFDNLYDFFKVTKTELKKTEIKNYLKNGGEIKGFSLEKKPTLRIS